MDKEIIGSRYVEGSDGHMRLFTRPAGTRVEVAGMPDFFYTQEKDAFIVQFGGFPEYDSGYAAHEFDSEADAWAYIEENY